MHYLLILKPFGCPTGVELPPITFDNFDLAKMFVGVLNGTFPAADLLAKVAELVTNPDAVHAMKALITACLGTPA